MCSDTLAPTRVPEPDSADTLRALLERQRSAQIQAGAPSAATRIDRLSRCIDLLLSNTKEITQALAQDFGTRSTEVSLLMDLAGPLAALKFARRNVTRWMKPERRWTSPWILSLLGAKATLHYQPKGVVGIVSPWNVPFHLVFAPLAGVLAAGNRAMIKPSELTPATSSLMERLVANAFSPDEVAVCTGGPDVAKAFSHLRFDHLVFTGGGTVARDVMRAAAENLVPLTLELGGKCPAIVSSTADISLAARRIMNGKLLNAGQTCLAPDYVLVQKDKLSVFVQEAAAAVRQFFPTLRDNPDYGSIISDRHASRLRGYIADARAGGATVLELIPPGEAPLPLPGRKIAPTLVINPSQDMAVLQEEIFGPILPILPYKDLDDALRYINQRERPLGLYWFGTDASEQETVLANTTSGGVTINDVLYHVAQDELPFGGIGGSGFGVYGGREGFVEFSHRKAVYQQLGRDIAPLRALRPPYGHGIRAYLASQIK
ncbi:coniferyl aldehyde dehydrogenase [Nitrospirillum viridazoti]|uniref:Aldehyde dehydrogenase n=1 Tax=Nitrospirillum viridazoti CBAmc TaxID=1441467 RepID=A0A248JVD7_9PROT|nr:coniferyl aldehyde dehydrogenase [Nitrospirillum amazonense]ASG22184.1 coniferyl aldehyde dehydrogenase [Nitrospirillum amazonense CBAmc]TWB31057.1 coniferyl-aldehyde dehydrogenase [Nitrospirillum amazonense]